MKLLGEPLLHFATGGAALLVACAWLNDDLGASARWEINGFFWPSAPERPESPAAAALADGAVLAKAKAGKGYFGYHYRVLTGQGRNITGGRYDYVINGNMIAGFALVAWPVKYGATGVNTFVVNRDGIVYQADLGEGTDGIAGGIRQFNPNDKWQIVKD